MTAPPEPQISGSVEVVVVVVVLVVVVVVVLVVVVVVETANSQLPPSVAAHQGP